MAMIEFRIEDMTCGHCASTITKAVQALDNAARVEIDLAEKRVRIDSPVAEGNVAAAIRSAGFTPVELVRS
jgi:copper chaperone